MWGQEEELPPFTVYFPGWMSGLHKSNQEICLEWGVERFAYQFELPGTGGLYVNEIHEFVNGGWV